MSSENDIDLLVDDLTLKPWTVGDEITAKHLDQPRQFIQRFKGGTKIPDQLRQSVPAKVTVRQFQIVELKTDYLIAKPYNGDEVEDNEVKIALPYLLRRTPFETLTNPIAITPTRGGFTYTYTTDSERISTKTSDSTTETQVLVPEYVVDDIIYAQKGVLGGVSTEIKDDAGKDIRLDWIDQNLDGRFWAKKSE